MRKIWISRIRGLVSGVVLKELPSSLNSKCSRLQLREYRPRARAA